MGIVQHDTVIVTGFFDIEHTTSKAWRSAHEYKLNPSKIVTSRINGFKTFIVATSGAKHGSDDYWYYKLRVGKFLESLKCFESEDGSTPLDIVHIEYGEYGTKILYTNRSEDRGADSEIDQK